MSILSLQKVSLNLAGKQLLDEVTWQIQPRDRIALVGRNGAGKSTLLKLLNGDLLHDSGQLHIQNQLKITGLTQTIPTEDERTVTEALTQNMGHAGSILLDYYAALKINDEATLQALHAAMDELQIWSLIPKMEAMASRLGLELNASLNSLSGGMKRRVLLGAALLAEPDLLILDEPTNHLDLQSIEWLEAYLKQFSGSVVVVTHDRAFLSQVANQIVEIDRGQLHTFHCNYETYLDRREAMRLSEQKQDALFDKQLSQEEAWLRQGIKARRTRNEGRVRALKKMRDIYAKRREELANYKKMALDTSRSGNLVLEAEHIYYRIDGRPLINDFSLVLMRGTKLGVVGPNGCGKTTLIRLLLGQLAPDSGNMRYGTSLNVAYFDQLRDELNEEESVMKNVADGADFITMNGRQQHVASYLKDFLFQPEQFNLPVSSLSGGERNRLLLAKLFAKSVNFLVMDEPTNDLDIATLELLESLLIDYQGTLIIISHDRAFINNVVTSLLVYEGGGTFIEFLGDYDTYKKSIPQNQPAKKSINPKTANNRKLSFNEQRELSQLPGQIEALESQINTMHKETTHPEFYQQDSDSISAFMQKIAENEQQLAKLYERWEMLEDRA